MAELLDVYDANMRHVGVAQRDRVHRDALWHRTFHCWVVTGRDGGALLFQLRSRNTESFPDRFDVSAAGHIKAGESTDEGLREVEEELGVKLPEGSALFLGQRVSVSDQAPDYRDRQVQVVHLVRLDLELSEYSPQRSEVAGLVWLPLDAGFRLFQGKSPAERAPGIRWDEAGGRWAEHEVDLAVDMLVPRPDNYYLAICIMAERLLRGEFPLAI